YGDDFSAEEIALWFEGEKEGFSSLWAHDRSRYVYLYHALNHAHGFRYLPRKTFRHALSLGGAYGDELLPLLPSVSRTTILETSDVYATNEIQGVPVSYVKPRSSGEMPFPDHTFDLATCFGCLHHIPNVSKVVGELFRCLEPGGVAIIREPIVSMGDWRHARTGLTKMERGIPLGIFRKILLEAKFTIQKETLCVFPLTSRLTFLFGPYVWNSPMAVFLDRLMAQAFAWNSSYHPSSLIQKLVPTAATYVLEKRR